MQSHAHAYEAGWMQIQTVGSTPDAPSTTVALYYPTMAAPRTIPMGPFKLDVAIGGKPVDKVKALILLSHGISGTETGHSVLAQALARNGYTMRVAFNITYIATDEGWLFLAVVIDLFSRQVVGWSLRHDMTRDIVIDALRMAWFKRHPGKQAGLMFHSDRGSQYASKDLRDVLKEYGIVSSMSRRGNCWDNACSETLFGSLKVERLYGQKFKTRREAKDETIAWLLWYNGTRLHSTLDYVSPMKFEQNWLANQPKQANS